VLWQLVFNLNDPVVGDRFMRTALALITDPDQLAADSVGFDDPLSASADSRVFAQGAARFGCRGRFACGVQPCPGGKVVQVTRLRADEHGTLRAYGVGSRLILTITGPQGSGVIDVLERQLQAEWASCASG